MNAVRYTCLLLIFAVLAGCGGHKRVELLPQHETGPQHISLVALFGARLGIGGQSIPVQGEVQMSESGGSLALILPHGRTLGICTFSPNSGPTNGTTDTVSAAGKQAVKMECTPAEGMGGQAAGLLFRAGVAVYRILPALGQSPAQHQLEGNGWSAYFIPAVDSLNGVYTEQNGMTMDMYFVEISHL